MIRPAIASPRPPSPVVLIWPIAIWPKITPSGAQQIKETTREAMAKLLVLAEFGTY